MRHLVLYYPVRLGSEANNHFAGEINGDYSPTLAFPKKRPDLVEDDGGGGFCICEAVGARDWRIE